MATVFENVFKITGAPGNLGAFFMRVFFTGYSRVGAHRIVTLQNKCYWHALVIRFFFGGLPANKKLSKKKPDETGELLSKSDQKPAHYYSNLMRS